MFNAHVSFWRLPALKKEEKEGKKRYPLRGPDASDRVQRVGRIPDF